MNKRRFHSRRNSNNSFQRRRRNLQHYIVRNSYMDDYNRDNNQYYEDFAYRGYDEDEARAYNERRYPYPSQQEFMNLRRAHSKSQHPKTYYSEKYFCYPNQYIEIYYPTHI